MTRSQRTLSTMLLVLVALASCSDGEDSGREAAVEQFETCPATDREPSELTGEELTDTINSIAGIYLTPQEIFSISCVYAPDAVVDGDSDSETLLAAEWAAVLRSGSFNGIEARRFPAAAVASQTANTAQAVYFVRSDPVRASSATLELVDGNWLIVAWRYEAECESILASISDVTLGNFWVEHARSSCASE